MIQILQINGKREHTTPPPNQIERTPTPTSSEFRSLKRRFTLLSPVQASWWVFSSTKAHSESFRCGGGTLSLGAPCRMAWSSCGRPYLPESAMTVYGRIYQVYDLKDVLYHMCDPCSWRALYEVDDVRCIGCTSSKWRARYHDGHGVYAGR